MYYPLNQTTNEGLRKKIALLDRESDYEDIYRRRNNRKLVPRIGFTLKEEIASAQAEYLRTHGVTLAEAGEGPKGNQTMEEFLKEREKRKREELLAIKGRRFSWQRGLRRTTMRRSTTLLSL